MRLPHIRLRFEPRDVWVGVYWDYPYTEGWERNMNIYVCLIPMLPLCITVTLESYL